MRALSIIALAIACAACASRPAPEEPAPAGEPGARAVAGFVAHVDEASGMAVIRTPAVFEAGTALRVECGRGAVGVFRVGSARDGMVAGLIESGGVVAGSCVLTPIAR